MDNESRISPDGRHVATLAYAGEIRFGPAYYTLIIDQREVMGIFGDEVAWSPDSRYLAAEEWLTTDYGEGPRTRAALFDINAGKVAPFKTIEKGFAGSFVFEKEFLVYKKRFLGLGRIEETEVDISRIENWQDAVFTRVN